jgi:folate-binding protein YgfZ
MKEVDEMAEATPLHAAAARAGARFGEDAGHEMPAHFGDVAAEYLQAHTGAVIFDRSHRGKVEAAEADAGRFLHNLSSNDILHLSPGAGCEAFLLTQKAKVVAYLTVFHLQGTNGKSSYWLDVAPGTATKVMAHLNHFLISERVELTDHTEELAQVHVAGPQASALLATVFPGQPAGDLIVTNTTLNEVTCQIRRHDQLGVPGYDVLCPATSAEALWARLTTAGVQPAGAVAYEILRIEAGMPAQGIDVDDNTFAPEVGRTAQAICYTKGCYLGQEPIVMARDRGQVNRFLRRLALPNGTVPLGSLLHRDAKEVGRVTSSALSPATGTGVGLGYVRRGSAEPGTALEVAVAGARQVCTVIG